MLQLLRQSIYTAGFDYDPRMLIPTQPYVLYYVRLSDCSYADYPTPFGIDHLDGNVPLAPILPSCGFQVGDLHWNLDTPSQINCLLQRLQKHIPLGAHVGRVDSAITVEHL